jgi:peroxiredoxin
MDWYCKENCKMTEQGKQTGRLMRAIICAIVLAALVIWAGCKKQPSGQGNAGRPGEAGPGESEPVTKGPAGSPETDVKPRVASTVSLNDVIKAARTWDVSFPSWAGKPAPSFTLTDTTGKEHTLSGYAGKEVVLVFWATYCGACRAEIPHLNELHNSDAEDKPVILAVSRENVNLLGQFVAREKIGFPVISNTGTMSMPYSLVQYIPSTFFIDRQGKIKLAVTGMVPVDEIKAIFQAR